MAKSLGIFSVRSTDTGSLFPSAAPTAESAEPVVNPIFSSVNGKSERFTTVARSLRASPGETAKSSPIASIHRPAHDRISSRSSRRFCSTQTCVSSSFIPAYTCSSAGTDAAGKRGSKAAMISSSIAPIVSPPGTRFQVVSMPSIISLDGASPSTRVKFSKRSPRRPAEPNPWVLCMDRLRAAISGYDSPSRGLYSPISTLIGAPAGCPPLLKLFQNSRLVCQVWVNRSCSGNFAGSAAAWNASTASCADAVWLPCPPEAPGGKRVTITSGRNFRITQTMSARICSFPQNSYVSSAVFEYPKSMARVKYCSAPSIRRAASNSRVRSIPISTPFSVPIRFWPPSPRVREM